VFAAINSGVKQIALASDDTLIYRQSNGALWQYSATDWSLLDGNVVSFVLNGDLVTATESGGGSRQFVV
jgi:hypothetical protein